VIYRTPCQLMEIIQIDFALLNSTVTERLRLALSLYGALLGLVLNILVSLNPAL
jgi:hypothetical protein